MFFPNTRTNSLTWRFSVENNNTWIIPVCVLAGAAAFGVAYFVMPDNKKNDPPPAFEQAAAANPNEPIVRPKQDEPKTFEPIRDEPAKVEPNKKETVKKESTLTPK